MSTVKVFLKTSNGTYTLEKDDFKLNANGRLPLRDIMHKWSVKDLVWIEMEEPLNVCTDGYSEMSFQFAANKTLDLSGTDVKTGQKIESSRAEIALPTKKAEKPKVEASTDHKTSAERTEEERLLRNLNKDNSAEAKEAAEKAKQAQAAAQAAVDAKKVEDARQKAEWTAKRDAENNRAKQQTNAAPAAATATPRGANSVPEETAVWKAADVLYASSAPANAPSDVKKCAQAALDAAEQMDIDVYQQHIAALFAAVRVSGTAGQLNSVRQVVPHAQRVALFGAAAASNPDDESATTKYSQAFESLRDGLNKL